MPINLEIDGKPVTVDNGATVMDAATKLGIFVPHFCYHKKLSIAANCRMHEFHFETRGETVYTKPMLLAIGDKYEAQIAAARGEDAPYR